MTASNRWFLVGCDDGVMPDVAKGNDCSKELRDPLEEKSVRN